MILPRRLSLDDRAHRPAHDQEGRHAGLRVLGAAPHVSETRHSDTLRVASVPHALHDRQIEKAVLLDFEALPRLERIAHGRARLEVRVDESPKRGSRRRIIGGASSVRSGGVQIASRLVVRAARTPTVRPDPGTSVPPARPRARLLKTAIPFRREAIWRAPDNPPSAWLFASTRVPVPALLS